jgi:hypothetical protein
MISLADPAFTRRLPSLVGETDKRMQEMEITESEIGLGEFVDSELVDPGYLLPETKHLRTAEVNTLVVENFSGYSDYYSPTPKVIITIVDRGKLTNVRVILDTRAEVSYISLDVVLRFKILITYSTRIAL